MRAAIDAEIPVTALPGPTALITALTISGLPTDRFLFAGFLPSRRAARRRALKELSAIEATLVFYESSRRLAATLEDMAAILQARDAVVARELTKFHEDTMRAPIAELAHRFADAAPPRGEIAIVIGPPAAVQLDEKSLDDLLHHALSLRSLRDAVDHVAADSGLPRRQVYRRALALTEKRNADSREDGD